MDKQEQLERLQAGLKAKREAGTLEQLDPIEKGKRNPTSFRLAITAKCWDCAGAGEDGKAFTRETIRACEAKSCPLWVMRPYQREKPWTMSADRAGKRWGEDDEDT